MAGVELNTIRVSSAESKHRNENQLVRHTQWLKICPDAITGKDSPSP
jgi:hypothetical protein